MIGELQRF